MLINAFKTVRSCAAAAVGIASFVACPSASSAAITHQLVMVSNSAVDPGEDPAATAFDGGVTHFTFDLQVIVTGADRWSATVGNASLTGGGATFFQHPDGNNDPPFAGIFGIRPALEFDSYWTAARVIGPGQTGAPPQFAGGVTVTATQMNATWFEAASGNIPGTFTVARYTVIVPAGVSGNVGTVSGSSTAAASGGTQFPFSFNFTIPPPPVPTNNQCENAATVFDGATLFSTAGATTDGPTEGLCNTRGDLNVTNDIWFRYTATCSGSLTFSLCGSSFDTRLAIYGSSCPISPSGSYACNDDSCGPQSSATINGSLGVQYLVRIGGYLGATGVGTLTISCNVPPPTCSAPAAAGSISTGAGVFPGLMGFYYDNLNWVGPCRAVRLDPTIDFFWDQSAPHPLIASDTFSVRWRGQVRPPSAGTWTFITTIDDGVRLTVNGQIIINRLTDTPPQENSGIINLNANTRYDIMLEYYDNTQGATARLEWQGPAVPRQVIPTSALSYTLPDAGPAPVCPADFNRSGTVSAQDIFDFLAAFFTPCP